MVKRVGIYEAKTHLSALLREVSNGERVVITYRGEDVAELVPPRNGSANAVSNLIANTTRLGVPIRAAIDEGRR